MADSHDRSFSSIDRRQLLRGTATAGAALLAGCSGDGDGSGGSGGGEATDASTDSSGRIDRALRLTDIYNPPDLQWNWLNPAQLGARSWICGEILYDRFLHYTPVTDEYHTEPFIINDWTFDGTSLTIDISEDHTWHDGDPVTADDVEAHWTLEVSRYRASGDEHSYIDQVEAVDDSTVEFTLHEEYAESIVLNTLFTGEDARLYTKRSLYEEWLPQLEDAESADEVQSVFTEIQNARFEEPVGNGPFAYQDASVQRTLFEVWEDYPTADQINFPRIEWKAFSDGQAELQAIRSGDIDATLAISPQEESVMQQWPAGLDTPRIDMPSYGGRAVAFQLDHEFLGDTAVRQAFAHVINRENIATNTPVNHEPVGQISGVPDETAETWLGEFQSDLTAYEPDEARAAELMESAGYERNDGQWVDGDGNTLSLTITTPPYADTFVPVAQTAADNLSSFGIDAQMRSVEPANHENKLNTGDYDMAIGGWGGSPHPNFTLNDIFAGTNAQSTNLPNEIEVPPVGEPDGDLETVNVVERVNSIPTLDRDGMEQTVRQLAWVQNQYLPLLPVTSAFNTGWLFTPDRFEYTTDDEGLMSRHNPLMTGPRMGFLEAK